MSSIANVLVTGATGNQGRAVIKALLEKSSTSTVNIYAVSRNTTSEAAKDLEAKSTAIKLVQGDFSDCEVLFKQCNTHIDAVFSVQVNQFGSPQQHQEELVQAKTLIDAALRNKVRHFVQASGDRGGPQRSEWDATGVPHLATKFQIEKYLQEKAGEQMSWTVLRLASFMVSGLVSTRSTLEW